MKLTVLGMYAPYAPAGHATSGYLIEDADEKILLDCGGGILERLQRVASIDEISAVALTHLHGDHIADMTLLRYAIPYRKRFQMGEKERMTVFCPPAPEAEYGFLRAMKPFDIQPVSHMFRAQLGNMTLEFHEMSHPYPAYGIRVLCGSKVFAYTGDTVLCPNLAALVKDADLLLCDASFLEADRVDTSTHMSARQAATIARDNGVKKLIITHRLAHYPEGLHLPEAKAIFRNTRQAFEMRSYTF